MTAKNNLTLTEINKIFYEKDGQLYWKISFGRKIVKNNLAGTISNNKYRHFQYNWKFYLTHRILYQIYNNLEEIPDGYVIDHIDKNPENNSKENLRICNRVQNQCNKKTPSNNKLGIKNISVAKSRKKLYYKTAVYINKKAFYKTFPYTEEGLTNAIKYRDELLLKHHGEFASKG